MNVKNNQPHEKKIKKITKKRLENIGLFYLERFESSVQNLREVLKRRIDKYAFENKEFNKNEAYEWVEEIIEVFKKSGYVNDERFAEMKVHDYLAAGKSARYIKTKLYAKGVDEKITESLINAQNYDGKAAALKFALKKHIGPYRKNENERSLFQKKDMACLLRAGFNYDDVCDILNMENVL